MKPLAPFPFNTPGVAGLNKQGQTAILGPEWATKALNLVIDDRGRLANRRGYKHVANVKTALGGRTIEKTFVGINNAGTRTVYCSDTSGRLYELSSGTWVDRTGAVTLPGNGNWQFVNFNGKVIAWHEDGRQVVQSAVGANFANIVASAGSVPQGKAVLSAFGRLWVVTDTTLTCSALLDETNWLLSGSAPRGYQFLLRYTWPKGADTATGLSEFNGRLAVFGTESVIIYDNPWDAPNMVFLDSIQNVGAVNRDTIQVAGSDIIFLSRSGVQSLGRVVQEKSNPLTDLVPQVRDYIATEYNGSIAATVESAYATSLGLYVLVLKNTTIVVDTKQRLPDGSWRVTEWDNMGAVSNDGYGGLYVSHGDELSQYTGVLDGVSYGGTGGTSIVGDYEGGWQDWEAVAQGVSSLNKYLKRVKLFVAGGGSGTLTLKWYFNYGETATTRSLALPAPPDAAKYGVAQYAIDKYGTSLDITELSKPGAKGGRVIKVGAKITGATTSYAINQMTLYATVGKQSH